MPHCFNKALVQQNFFQFHSTIDDQYFTHTSWFLSCLRHLHPADYTRFDSSNQGLCEETHLQHKHRSIADITKEVWVNLNEA